MRVYGFARSIVECPRWYGLRPMFQGNRVLTHVTWSHWQRWRYYAWFRLGDDHIWPLTLHLDLSMVIRGQWPLLTPYFPIVINLTFFWRGWAWGPETEKWLIFYTDMFIVPLYIIRCQSGPLTEFALRRFCRLWCRCSLPGCYASEIFNQYTVMTLYFVPNWTTNMLMKVLCR